VTAPGERVVGTLTEESTPSARTTVRTDTATPTKGHNVLRTGGCSTDEKLTAPLTEGDTGNNTVTGRHPGRPVALKGVPVLTPLQTVTPGRFGPMMMADGEFMCAECVVENKDRINEAADSDGSVIELAQWASVGYCGGPRQDRGP